MFVPEIVCAEDPLKVTVFEDAEYVSELVQFPPTVISSDTEVNVPPLSIVTLPLIINVFPLELKLPAFIVKLLKLIFSSMAIVPVLFLVIFPVTLIGFPEEFIE